VDHPTGGQVEAGRRLRLTYLAAAERPTELQKLRPCSPMDRPVDATPTEERRVRRIHDRVGIERRDVALHGTKNGHGVILA
jgi:hypothetical protein